MYINKIKYGINQELPDDFVQDFRENVVPAIIRKLYTLNQTYYIKYNKSDQSEAVYLRIEKDGYHALTISIRNHVINTAVDKVFYITNFEDCANIEKSVIFYLKDFDWETKRKQYDADIGSSTHDIVERPWEVEEEEENTEVQGIMGEIKERMSTFGEQLPIGRINQLLFATQTINDDRDKLRMTKEVIAQITQIPVYINSIDEIGRASCRERIETSSRTERRGRK